jgi:hypothetical protein
MHKVLALIGLWLAAGAAATAQTKPDFSGDWKLNIAKSEFGQMPAPDSMSQKIDYKDPDLKVTTHAVGGPQGDVTYDAKYTTDGKECLNQFGDQIKAKSKLAWDGSTLVVDTNMDFGEMQITIKGKWTLSEDGKVLKQTAHFDSPQGSIDVTYLFDKQ